ncbi:type 1 fimbrial protein [Stenotrophomonas maltophilia]|nr:type 1 fimbrial protein [Stenotrophomonas maltophilia]UXB38816.1 fimbrial protein [Stenotrophomonas maltophilia]
MNKLAIALTAALSLGAAASASAADATIDFSGEIKDLTCSIGVGSASNTSLTLKTITTDAVNNGAASRQTPFQLAMGEAGSTCAAGAVELSFEKTNVSSAGRLTNTDGTGAENIELAILNGTTPMNLNSDVLTHTFPAGGGTHAWNLTASYEKAGAADVTEGNFETALLINVKY